MKQGIVGNCTFALQEIAKPDIKPVRSVLTGTILRLGDVDTKADEAIEILVKSTKCTAIVRPKSWKKYALRGDDSGQAMVIESSNKSGQLHVYAPLKMRTEYYVDRSGEHETDADGDVKMEADDGTNLLDSEIKSKDSEEKKEENLEKVEREELIRGFKYGTTYVPCSDGQFPRLQTKKGIDICGFFPRERVRFFHSYITGHSFRYSSATNLQWEKSNIFGPILRLLCNR
jgi:ATP-dependent DNA helicase 2 subunit 2